MKYRNPEFMGSPRTNALNRSTPVESENLINNQRYLGCRLCQQGYYSPRERGICNITRPSRQQL